MDGWMEEVDASWIDEDKGGEETFPHRRTEEINEIKSVVSLSCSACESQLTQRASCPKTPARRQIRIRGS